MTIGLLAALVLGLGLPVKSGVLSCPTAVAAQKTEMTGTKFSKTPVPARTEQASLLTEYGVTLAMRGDVARAESVFVSVLSVSPKDPSALNNLGNLHLIKGEPAVALAFYNRAMVFDTTDAGIRLNRSLAMMLTGDNEEARAEAKRAVRMAGGVDLAAALLALKTKHEPSKEAKASTQTYLSKSEVMALLESAVSGVPADTSRAAQSDSARAASKTATAAKVKAWRSAGLRAEDMNEVTTSVYWKK
jgi:Flp pilus assembly protein TadD